MGGGLCHFLSGRDSKVTATGRSDHFIFGSSEVDFLRLDVCNPVTTGPLPTSDIAFVCPWVNDVDEARSPSWIEQLLRRLVDADVRSVIYLSTVWVYGAKPEGLLTESTVVGPTNSYGAAHLRNESALSDLAGDLGLDVSILRMANLVGPDPFFRFRKKIAFAHELMAMALDDQSVVLRSPPSTPRNFLTRSLFHHYLGPLIDRGASEGRVEVFNLGSGSTGTVLEFAQRIATLVEQHRGGPVRVEYPTESTSQVPFHLDTTRIRSLAGPGIDDLDLELSLVLDDVVVSRAQADEMEGPE